MAMNKHRPSQRAYMQKYNHERRDYRRQYRLSKSRWHYQSVRLDHDEIETLRALAKRQRTTVPELIRAFVAWGLEEYELAKMKER
jgi:hypothetical protein